MDTIRGLRVLGKLGVFTFGILATTKKARTMRTNLSAVLVWFVSHCCCGGAACCGGRAAAGGCPSHPHITMVPSSLIPNGPRRVREPGRAVKPCTQRWLSHETNRLPTASTSLIVAPSCRDLSTDPVMPEMVILSKKSKSRI